MSRVGWNRRVPRAAQLPMLLTQGASPSGMSDLPLFPALGWETGSPQIDQGASVFVFPSALRPGFAGVPFPGTGTATRSATGGALPHRFCMVPSRSVTRKAKRLAIMSS